TSSVTCRRASQRRLAGSAIPFGHRMGRGLYSAPIKVFHAHGRYAKKLRMEQATRKYSWMRNPASQFCRTIGPLTAVTSYLKNTRTELKVVEFPHDRARQVPS